MTIEQILQRYKTDRANLNMTKMTILAIRQNIFEESAVQSGERVQTSNISDTTCQKVIKILDNTEEYEKREMILTYRCGMVENALSVLSEREVDMVERFFFKNQTYAKIDCETGVPESSTKRYIRNAKRKMKPLLSTLMDVDLFWP